MNPTATSHAPARLAPAGRRRLARSPRLRPFARAMGQALALAAAGAAWAPAGAVPSGAQVVLGDVRLSQPAPGQLLVTQADKTPRAIVNWQSFSIAAGESVRLQQPTGGVALFNVIGNEASQIFGSLVSNGALFLTNPNGVLFGAGSRVEVGALVASTLQMSNSDFSAGNYRFSGSAASTARVVNQGVIKAKPGSYAVLLGQSVENTGSILAEGGTVALGAASAATLDVYGNGLLTLQLNTAADGARVTQGASGALLADGGRIEVSALGTSARPAAINVDGLLQAQTLAQRNGQIVLTARGADASLSFAQGATANADGGGSVRLLSDGSTNFAGRISAREGGSAEVSGAGSVTATGLADLSSADGRFGNLLIDPAFFVIRAGGLLDGSANILTDTWLAAQLATANVELLTTGAAPFPAPSIDVKGDTRLNWAQPTTLTLNAATDIVLRAGAEVRNTNAGSTAFDALVLNANVARTSVGSSAGIQMAAGSQLETTRGSIRLTGVGGTTSSGNYGVALVGAKVRSGDGDITVSGTAGGDGTGKSNTGVLLSNESQVLATGTGALTLSGTGGSGRIDAPGVNFTGNASTLATTSGALTVSGRGGQATEGLTQGIVSSVGANIRSTSGAIALLGSTTSTAVDGIAFLAGANRIGNAATSGDISLTADRITLADGSRVQTSGTALLQTRSSERPINIGAGDTNVSLGLAGAELNRITAGRIQIGNTKAGDINLSQSFQPTGTSVLSLVSLYAVTESPLATFTVPQLSIQAASVNLPNANRVGTLAGTASRGSFVFNEADALTVGSVAGNAGGLVNGIRAAGALTLTATAGRLTLDQPLSAGAAGDALTTVSQSFTNNAGAAALSAGNGRWRVFSSDPANDDRGAQAFDFKRYDCNFSGSCAPGIPGSGNGFLYSIAPVLGVEVRGDGGFYGNAPVLNPAGYSLSGLIDGDTAGSAGISGTAQFSTTADATVGVGSYPIRYDGGLASTLGYRFAQVALPSSVYLVRPRPISITADAQSRIYGNANPSLTYQVGGLGLVNGDTLTGALSTTASATSNVGAYAITQGSLAASSNYAVDFTSANLTVAARALSIAANAQSRVYGNANPALTYTVGGLGLVNGDTLTGALSTTASATSNVGAYAITQGSLAASSNYAVDFTSANLTVAARALSIAANAQSRVYGNANPALTYTVGGLGLVNGDTLTGALSTTASATSNVGAYAITQGSLAASSNYAVDFTSANLTVAARALSIAANAQSRVYGNANPALTYTVGGLGLVNGDTLTGALSTTASATSNVGAYAITQGSLAASSNYAVDFTSANLTVAARALSIAANAQSRVYGNANPALTYTVGGLGLVNGDTVSGELSTTASATSNVGAYAITQGSLAASSNYAVDFTSANLTVAARALSIAANAQSRVYGNANPALTYTVGGLGLVNGDTLTGALSTTASATSNVGVYAITQGSLAASSNYAVDFTSANLTVAARALTIAANAQSRVYGNANPALTYTVGGLGLVNGDTLTGALSTTASATSNVGAYAITQGSLAASSNYAVDFTSANLTVAARALSIAANAQSRVYGNANPTLTYTVGGLGLVNGDTLTGALSTTASATSNVGAYAITQGSLAASSNYAVDFTSANLTVAARALSIAANAQSRVYGNANPTLTYTVGGLGLVNGDTVSGELSTTASATSNVGAYAITQGSLAASSNYAVDFTSANLTVAARALSIAANAQSRVYGNANPALTYTVGGLGLVNGDTLTGALSTTASATSNVGSYAIGLGSLSASPNYSVAFTPANLAVTARAITLAPVAQSRAYGDANPTSGAATVTLGNLVNGDTVASVTVSAPAALATSGAGSTAPLLASNASFGNGLAANYSIAYAPGSLAISQRGIAVAALAGQGKAVGAPEPALAFAVVNGSLVNGDAFSGGLVRAPGEAPGAYTIGLGTLTAGANYALSYSSTDFLVAGTAVIGPIDLTPTQGTPVSNPLATFLASLDNLAPTAAGPDAAGACIVEQPLGYTGDLVQRATTAPAADNRLVNAGIRLPRGVVDPCRVLPERERKAPFLNVSAL